MIITCDSGVSFSVIGVLVMVSLVPIVLVTGEGGQRALALAAQAVRGAAQGRAGVSVAADIVSLVVIVLVIQNHLAEHQEVFRGASSLWRWRTLTRIKIQNQEQSLKVLMPHIPSLFPDHDFNLREKLFDSRKYFAVM